MSKGSYAATRNGEVVGHYVYTEGEGWVYRPLPEPKQWIELA